MNKRMFPVIFAASIGVLLFPTTAYGNGVHGVVVGIGGPAVASDGSDTETCTTEIVVSLTEYEPDASPPGTSGKVQAVGRALCAGPISFTNQTLAIWVYADGVLLGTTSCPNPPSFDCTTPNYSFTGPAEIKTGVVTYWTLSRGAWDEAEPNQCKITTSTKAQCHAGADLTV